MRSCRPPRCVGIGITMGITAGIIGGTVIGTGITAGTGTVGTITAIGEILAGLRLETGSHIAGPVFSS